jgi:hypothetical protein
MRTPEGDGMIITPRAFAARDAHHSAAEAVRAMLGVCRDVTPDRTRTARHPKSTIQPDTRSRLQGMPAGAVAPPVDCALHPRIRSRHLQTQRSQPRWIEIRRRRRRPPDPARRPNLKITFTKNAISDEIRPSRPCRVLFIVRETSAHHRVPCQRRARKTETMLP